MSALSRPRLVAELRKVLNHPAGFRGAGSPGLEVPALRSALESRGLLGPSQALADALRQALCQLVPSLPDVQEDVKAAVLLHFGVLPEFVRINNQSVALADLTAAGRRQEACRRAHLTRDQYDHDRKGRRTALTSALLGFEALLTGKRTSEPRDAKWATIRREHASDVDGAWALLAECRRVGDARRENLSRLLEIADALAQKTELEEASAIVEFARYEQSRGVEAYRLVQGLTLLETAQSAYESTADAALTGRLSLQLLAEYAQVFLTGDRVPGGRLIYLERLEALAERLIEDRSLRPLDEACCRVSLGEALKERAQVTHDAQKQQELCRRSRDECQGAIRLVERTRDVPQDAKLRVRASAKRHAAITFEMEADKAISPELRRDNLEKWLLYSEEAATDADGLDDFVRGYALMNAASAHSRLADLELSPARKAARLREARPHLETSGVLLERLEDIRGQGWVNIHWCDNHNRTADLTDDREARIAVLRQFETCANVALSFLTALEDELGSVFAYLQLGRALYRIYKESGSDAASRQRLEQATSVLAVAHRRTSEIGFYRESLSAARMLAACLYDTWTQSPRDTTLLVRAIEAQITGLCEIYSGQGAEQELRTLYADLDQTLHARLDDYLRPVSSAP